ncbi:MAG: hypothetical protein JO117_04035 [Verrucomicrobia bacterium]|nr:hypothetical protein [Verrucomicrobiota bacterium]MBV9657400.1 hypothetical protein [Verrucomicrobiota bacterium]
MNNDPSVPTNAGGSLVRATFGNRREAQKAINELKTAGFLGSEIAVTSEEQPMVKINAGPRAAEAERILRAAGGSAVTREMTDAEILAATEKIQPSPRARAAVEAIEEAEHGVPPTVPRPHANDDERSGRLIS